MFYMSLLMVHENEWNSGINSETGMNLGEDRDSKNMLISPFWGAFLGLN
jgi:hypothetical protein